MKLPAILGGLPVRPQGPPTWPETGPGTDPAVHAALERCWSSGDWARYEGAHTEELMNRVAELSEQKFVILCSSGTAAVELALRAAKVGPGDEVVSAGYDFKGNAGNILALGATPVFADVDPATCSLTVDGFEIAATLKTKAVVLSHLHGAVGPMDRLVESARSRGVIVIEDACQTPGGVVYGKPAGSWGDLCVFSFGGSKLLTAGRGGAVATSNPALAQRIRLHVERGNTAYPLSQLQASVLGPQIDALSDLRAQRRASVSRLFQQLAGLPGLRPLVEAPGCEADYYKVGLVVDPEYWNGVSRDWIAAAARAEGIALDAGFRALHRSFAASRFRAAEPLIHSEHLGQNMLVLHHPVLLAGERAVDEVMEALVKIHDAAMSGLFEGAAPP